MLARTAPAVYVVEDAHWIDEVSESMLADFLTVVPQTPSLVLITYRPEYHGALAHMADEHTITLVPLSDSDTATLVAHLLGADARLRDWAAESPKEPPAIRTSPKSWCATWPNAVCCGGASRAHTCRGGWRRAR